MPIVEIHVQALGKTLGLVDHYFMIIGDLEYHLGYYSKGSILAKGSTKGSHCTEIRTLCSECFIKLQADYNSKEDKRMFLYYPIINCETLCTGFSIQGIALLTIPLICLLLLKHLFFYALILFLIVIIVLLLYSKYNFSKCQHTKCRHLKEITSK